MRQDPQNDTWHPLNLYTFKHSYANSGLITLLTRLMVADELRVMTKLPARMRREVDSIAVANGRGKRWMSGQSSRDRSSTSSRHSSPPPYRDDAACIANYKDSGDDFGMVLKRSAASSAANSPPHAERERNSLSAAEAARRTKEAADKEKGPQRSGRFAKLTTDVLY